jgi:hypothetical protein
MITDAQKGGITLLDSYSNCWQVYSKAVKQIDSICMYVNKVIDKLKDEHLPSKTAIVMINGERMEVRLKPVGALGFHIWKKAVLYFAKEKLGNVLVQEILAAFQTLRVKGNMEISMKGLEGAIKSFHECDQHEFSGPVPVPFKELDNRPNTEIPTLYELELEAPFLAATRDFYITESAEKIAGEDITGYVRYAEKRLREEVQSAKSLFPIGSSLKIISAVELQLVTLHTDRLQKDFNKLLEKSMRVELEIVYRLLERIPDGIEPLANCFENYVFQQARRAVEKILDQSDSRLVAADYVGSLACLAQSIKMQVTSHFNADMRFMGRIADAFRCFMEVQPPCTTRDAGSLIADYFDMLMQDEVIPENGAYTGLEKSEALATCIDNVIVLVKYLETKEEFMNAYIVHLAERLLYRLSHHGDIEATLIVRLGDTCGFEAQTKMRKMFSDMHMSSQLRKHFSKYVAGRAAPVPCKRCILY